MVATSSQTIYLYLEHTFVHQCNTLLGFFPIFSQSLIMQIFFTFGIGPDILMNGLEDCIIFLIWATLALLISVFSKSFQSFTENVSFISFYGGIWSTYSEIV